MAVEPERPPARSGIDVKPLYTAADVDGLELEPPGTYPFTRGPYPTMYRGRPWTIRQYAGFGSAEETNERFRYLLARRADGTVRRVRSADPARATTRTIRGAAGEVGRSGVAIDSIADMERVFEGIPLDDVSTSMTINAPASILLLLYELVAEGQGVSRRQRSGEPSRTTSSRSTSRAGTTSSRRGRRCGSRPICSPTAANGCRSGTRSRSPATTYARPASTAVQELAFTLANGIAYCEAAIAAGLSVDDFGERLSFFFNAHNDFFQEVAKFRAARTLWARIMRDRFGATNPRAQALRFHAQTGGSTLTAQQPENNIVRVAVQALSAVCGGAQSIHTNGFDEALAIPTEHVGADRAPDAADPRQRGGNDGHRRPARRRLLRREPDTRARGARPGADRPDRRARRRRRCHRGGFVQAEIEDSAFADARRVEAGERVIVGVNEFTDDGDETDDRDSSHRSPTRDSPDRANSPRSGRPESGGCRPDARPDARGCSGRRQSALPHA